MLDVIPIYLKNRNSGKGHGSPEERAEQPCLPSFSLIIVDQGRGVDELVKSTFFF